MENRIKIEKFCKDNSIKIISLKYIIIRDAEKDYSWETSFWDLDYSFNNKSYNCTTTERTINDMFSEIIVNLKNSI